MSRNLVQDYCPACEHTVVVEELAGCKIELRQYHHEPVRALVKYKCPTCSLKLLVWLDSFDSIIDLSYYESFNDEPNSEGDPNVYHRPK